MKLLVTSILAALLCQHSFAQIADTETSNKMAARIVEVLNKADAKALEAMATQDFLETIPKGALVGMALGIRSLGTLSDPTLILDLGEQRHYKVTVKQSGKPDKQILLVLGVESADKYFSIGAAPYREPITREKPYPSDNPLKTELDRAVQGAVDRYIGQNSPVGISIGISSNGKESFYNYGAANKETGNLATSKTTYEIGSITKSMTGILIGQAILDKKLSLDDDIRKFLLAKYPNLEVEGTPIRLRDLVTHRSGLPANPPGIPDDAGAEAYEKYSHERLLADLAAVKLSKKPGSNFAYSNMGAGLCSLILEKVYGLPYERLLQQYIFKPAHMRSSAIRLTPKTDKTYAIPYDAKGSKTDRWTVNGIESAGAVRSNAEDMVRYGKLNLDTRNRAAGLSHEVLTPSGTTPMGIFWQVGNSRAAGRYFTHEGGTGGFTSNIIVIPEKKLVIVVLMNSGEQQAGQLGYEIALRYLAGSR